MNSITHAEIPYVDNDRAKAFYENVFDWHITKIPELNYYWVTTTESNPDTMMPKNPGAINCGMVEKKDPTHGPTIVINVASIDLHAKKITDAGGKIIIPKTTVSEYGYYAVFTDTEGNNLALWENSKH